MSMPHHELQHYTTQRPEVRFIGRVAPPFKHLGRVECGRANETDGLLIAVKIFVGNRFAEVDELSLRQWIGE